MEIKISIGAGRAVGMSPITEGIRFPGEREDTMNNDNGTLLCYNTESI